MLLTYEHSGDFLKVQILLFISTFDVYYYFSPPQRLNFPISETTLNSLES